MNFQDQRLFETEVIKNKKKKYLKCQLKDANLPFLKIPYCQGFYVSMIPTTGINFKNIHKIRLT